MVCGIVVIAPVNYLKTSRLISTAARTSATTEQVVAGIAEVISVVAKVVCTTQ
jgi:hypothetical protein